MPSTCLPLPPNILSSSPPLKWPSQRRLQVLPMSDLGVWMEETAGDCGLGEFLIGTKVYAHAHTHTHTHTHTLTHLLFPQPHPLTPPHPPPLPHYCPEASKLYGRLSGKHMGPLGGGGMVGKAREFWSCLPALYLWPQAWTAYRLCTSLKFYLSLAAQNVCVCIHIYICIYVYTHTHTHTHTHTYIVIRPTLKVSGSWRNRTLGGNTLIEQNGQDTWSCPC